MTIDPKRDHTLYGVFITKTKIPSTTFALIPICRIRGVPRGGVNRLVKIQLKQMSDLTVAPLF
jgi:hypothetical protein